MSLNAIVYCDCVERGRLTIPHPRPDILSINDRGEPVVLSTNTEDIEAHDRWESLKPCKHERFWLIERWLGNVSLIDSLRTLLERYSGNPANEYPTLYSRVIYDGSHSGDFLPIDAVVQLNEEIHTLRRTKSPSTDSNQLTELLQKLDELIKASLSVNKPITF